MLKYEQMFVLMLSLKNRIKREILQPSAFRRYLKTKSYMIFPVNSYLRIFNKPKKQENSRIVFIFLKKINKT